MCEMMPYMVGMHDEELKNGAMHSIEQRWSNTLNPYSNPADD